MDRNPTDGGGTFSRFVAELRRRHVGRAALAYAAVAFVVLQAAEIVLPAFDAPDWGLRLIVVVAALGFPVALALAWVYEITPHGVRTMARADADAGVATPDAGSVLPRLALLVVTVASAAFTGWWWLEAVEGDVAVRDATPAAFVAGDAGADAPIRSLAVLPLESFSDAGSDDVFARGMHEALVSQLSQLGTVRVLSRTTVSQYDRSGKSAARIGAELGVEGLVEGSVLRAGDRVRITVQLIHAPSDRHLWARDYERDLEDVIALQREVAEAIADEIGAELAPATTADGPRSASAAPADPRAALDVMEGQAALSESSPAEARRHFQAALARDSTYAPAYAGLAGSRLVEALTRGSVDAAGLREVRELAERALALDPSSREAEEVLAQAERMAAPGAPAASPSAPSTPRVPRMREVVRVLPTGDTIRFPVPMEDAVLPGMPSVTELGRQVEAAMAHVSAGNSRLPEAQAEAARRLAALGRTDQALTVLEAALRAAPRDAGLWDELERVHALRGDAAAAAATRRERLERLGPSAGGADVGALERAVSRDGLTGYWGWRLGELMARAEAGESVSPVLLATAHAAAGDRETALELLEAGVEEGDPLVAGVKQDPAWDRLRDDPAFGVLLRAAQARGRRGG